MEIGSKVKLIQPVIQGEIIDTEYDKDSKCLRHMLRYTDINGEEHCRWFLEKELEEI